MNSFAGIARRTGIHELTPLDCTYLRFSGRASSLTETFLPGIGCIPCPILQVFTVFIFLLLHLKNVSLRSTFFVPQEFSDDNSYVIKYEVIDFFSFIKICI